MAYEPLHHKYRPQRFAELVGQEAIATTLTNALRQQKIAPAYLFTGARGTGKTSSARILAKSLNCLSDTVPTATPCGTCEVCRAIANGSALDVIEIDAASNTGVDNIRELIERAQFAPVQCRYKVYTIDEVHMLSQAAFNALLKTLEEPPDRVVFILATTDPQRVLPTIISRCQRFDFRRIPLDDMVRHLSAIAIKEAIDIAPDAVQLVGQISQGGLRDAQSLLDQLSLLEGQITVERVWDLVGAVPERDLLKLVQAIIQDDAITVLDQARHLMDRGREPLIVLQNLAGFYRDLLVAKTAPNRNDLVAITSPTWADMCRFVEPLDIAMILQGQQHLRSSEVQVKNTTQPRLWLEVTLMGLLPAALLPSVSQQSTTHAPMRSPMQNRKSAASPASPAASTLSGHQPPVSSPLPSPVTIEQAEPTTEPAPIAEDSFVQPETAQSPTENDAADLSPAPPPATSAPKLAETTGELDATSDDMASTESPTEESLAVDLDQTWNEILNLVQPFSTQIMLRQQCQLLAFNGQNARIGTKSQPLFKMAQERLPNVEAAFAQVFNSKVRVSLEVINLADVTSQTPSASAESSRSPTHAPPRPIARESSPSIAPAPAATNQPPAPAAAHLVRPSDTMTDAPAQSSWHDDDDVGRAAKSLAQMFNGQIVSLESELQVGELSSVALTPEVDLDDPDGDDDDVPF